MHQHSSEQARARSWDAARRELTHHTTRKVAKVLQAGAVGSLSGCLGLLGVIRDLVKRLWMEGFSPAKAPESALCVALRHFSSCEAT